MVNYVTRISNAPNIVGAFRVHFALAFALAEKVNATVELHLLFHLTATPKKTRNRLYFS